MIKRLQDTCKWATALGKHTTVLRAVEENQSEQEAAENVGINAGSKPLPCNIDGEDTSQAWADLLKS